MFRKATLPFAVLIVCAAVVMLVASPAAVVAAPIQHGGFSPVCKVS